MLPMAATLVGVAAWVYLLFRYGREGRPKTRADHLSTPPAAYHPNVVQHLMSWGLSVDPSLAVLDLARRGALRVVARQDPPEDDHSASRRLTDYALEGNPAFSEPLSASDRLLLEQVLFGRTASGPVLLAELADLAKADRQEAARRSNAWSKQAAAECEAFGLVAPPPSHLRAGSLAIASALVALGVLDLSEADIAAFLPLLVGLLLAGATFLLKRRTAEGAEAAAAWAAFGRHLSRFMDRKYVAPEVSASEAYLAYAEALGASGAAGEQFSKLGKGHAGTDLAFVSWRHENGAPVADLPTAVALFMGFSRALRKLWEAYVVTRGR